MIVDVGGDALVFHTLGHGTATAAAFTEVVSSTGLAVVVDVRRYPGSRRHPHFDAAAMAGWLADAGVAYRWLPGLGGRRAGSPASPNTALDNPQFRAYADHMASPEFARSVEELVSIGRERSVAIMCAESLWWRCHRRLLADHLWLVEGHEVQHLFPDGRHAPHRLTAGARRVGRVVRYDLRS